MWPSCHAITYLQKCTSNNQLNNSNHISINQSNDHVWNGLPQHVWPQSLSTFCSRLKTHLFHCCFHLLFCCCTCAMTLSFSYTLIASCHYYYFITVTHKIIRRSWKFQTLITGCMSRFLTLIFAMWCSALHPSGVTKSSTSSASAGVKAGKSSLPGGR